MEPCLGAVSNALRHDRYTVFATLVTFRSISSRSRRNVIVMARRLNIDLTVLVAALTGSCASGHSRAAKVSGVGVSDRYVNASGRFSIDLRRGRLRGPLTSRAPPILPDFLSLP